MALTTLGALTANLVGRSVVEFGEVLLARTPVISGLYRGLRQIFETLFSANGTSFRTVAGPSGTGADCSNLTRRPGETAILSLWTFFLRSRPGKGLRPFKFTMPFSTQRPPPRPHGLLSTSGNPRKKYPSSSNARRNGRAGNVGASSFSNVCPDFRWRHRAFTCSMRSTKAG